MPRRFSVSAASRLGVSAVVIAIFAAVYTYVFGTDDFEESNIVAWSAGLQHEWFASHRGPRSTGSETSWGVPVYDALKATGNQLPYQASWAQLPFWFLRYPLFWKEFIALHLFVATLCAMMLSLQSLQSWVPELSLWRLTGVGVVLLSTLGLMMGRARRQWRGHFVRRI